MNTPYLDEMISELDGYTGSTNYLSKRGNEKLKELKAIKEKLTPHIIEVNFDGHLKCQIETTDCSPKILRAVNGFGNSVNCNDDSIRIKEI
tara:strand:- start:1611 stop:1883 length:273 start_codon:yes stop_codon:yes gene_type:complete